MTPVQRKDQSLNLIARKGMRKGVNVRDMSSTQVWVAVAIANGGAVPRLSISFASLCDAADIVRATCALGMSH
jgi:hypothetical protein